MTSRVTACGRGGLRAGQAPDWPLALAWPLATGALTYSVTCRVVVTGWFTVYAWLTIVVVVTGLDTVE